MNTDSDSTDSAFEYDIKMNGKSFEVTDREGQSALVPGVTATKPPVESSSRPFTNYKTPRFETEVEIPKSTRTTSSMVAKGGTPVQEMERHGDHQSIPVYSIQAERSRSTSSSDEETPLLSTLLRRPRNIGICRQSSLKSCLTTGLLIIIGILLISIFGSMIWVTSTKPEPIFKGVDVDNEDTVLVDFFDTFLYKEIEISKAEDSHCPDCKVEIYSFYPDDIIVDDNYYNISADSLTTTHDDILLSPNYFISNSKIKVSVTFYPQKDQNTTVEFLLFNDLELYEPFQRGEKPNPYQIYPVQVNEKEKTFSIVIVVANTGYFFLGIRPSDSPVTFGFQITVQQIYYSRKDFPSLTCLLESTKSCTIRFTVSHTDEYTDTLKTCIFVYSIPPPNFPKSYYVSLEYNVYRGFWNTWSIGLVSGIGVSSLCVSVLCCYYIFCLCNCARAHKRKF